MSDKIVLEVNNRTELENLAHSRGFDSVQEYLLALIEEDSSEELDISNPADNFRQGWREVLSGHEGIPYDQVWEGIEDDAEG